MMESNNEIIDKMKVKWSRKLCMYLFSSWFFQFQSSVIAKLDELDSSKKHGMFLHKSEGTVFNQI